MEVDSMHATIENARKHQRTYTPRKLEVVIRGARKRPHPYAVNELKHTDFVDTKELAAKKTKTWTINTDGGIVNWLDIKWLRFEKSAPHTIQYKHLIQSDGFMKLVVSSERVRLRVNCIGHFISQKNTMNIQTISDAKLRCALLERTLLFR